MPRQSRHPDMSQGKLLFHICCGPCALYPGLQLLRQGFEVLGLFYNPNIHPLKEYLRRRQGVEQAAEYLGIKVIFLDREYDPVSYLRQVVFRENSRCFLCYQMRLQRTLQVARKGDFDFFSTSLLYSKQQRHQEISDLARDIALPGKIKFLYQDFRQGWKQGLDLSLKLGLYRQDYCGCIYSEINRFQSQLDQTGRKGFKPSTESGG